jgi:two-component system response regulator PilR (NtrC family)
MESEFFGHKKGSFTGAVNDKVGLFQAAEGGTLFLDEVADLPLHMQVKLLRAIQEKAIRPIGAEQETPINVRILSATHQNLHEEVAADRFRKDLFYRINVIELHGPSLRERASDIPGLCEKILQDFSNNQETPSLTAEAIHELQNYPFPGNVRELENILERAYTLCDGNQIDTDDLQLGSSKAQPQPASGNIDDEIEIPQQVDSLEDYLEKVERKIITNALEKNRWNKTAAAKMLGLSFRQMRYRLKKLGLE